MRRVMDRVEWGMSVGKGSPSPIRMEYGETKIIDNSSKSTDGHSEINTAKRQTSGPTDPLSSPKLTRFA